MSIFDIFKPSPYIQEIKDEKIVRKKYRYWRIRIFYSMYLGYALFYLSRKSYNFAMPFIIHDLGFTKTQVGIVGSMLTMTYGFSKFITGIMSDKSNPRYFMAIGLIFTGVFNILFGFSSSLIFFIIFAGFNGWFQGFGWPPCAKLLTHWYSHSERGAWWSVWNTSHNVGGATIPVLTAFIATHFGWRYSMYLPGIICILGGIFLINRLRDTPRSLGLPSVEKYKKETLPSNKEKETLKLKDLLYNFVLNNKYIWFLAITSFFIYVIRTSINDWSMLFLIEQKGYSKLVASLGPCLFEVGGFLGSLTAGWSSDILTKGKRGPINFVFTLFLILTLLIFWQLPAIYVIIDYILLTLIGFFVFGPQMLMGIVAAESSHKKAAGTATGFIGVFGYVGATAAGGPLGKIIEKWGWGEGFFTVLVLSGIIALIFFIFLLPAKAKV
ncbi:MAG: MFS transporter [Chlamydiae bacterium SM23_39]|nr:MAG: MFS transporter [Chlamydiae bacterium SM23_39]